MKNRTWWFLAGLVALAGGVLGLLNPVAAQVTSTTIAGSALVVMGLLQGRAAWASQALRERTGAALLAAVGLFLGLSLLAGPFGDGTVLRWLLGGLLIAGAAAKLWIGRRAKTDRLFWIVVGAGALSGVLGVLVLAAAALPLGVIVSVELLGSGAALIVMALRLEKPGST